jgi:integrase
MNGGRATVPRKIKLKHVNIVRRRLSDGSYRIHRYHRLTGQKLAGEPGSAEFRQSYAEAELHAIRKPNTGLAGLIAKYKESPDFTELRESTRDEYERLLAPAEAEFGTMSVAVLEDLKARGAFLEWRDKTAKQHGLREAENRLTRLARVLAWSFDRGLLKVNVLARWERKYSSDRSEMIWTPEHIEKFNAVAPGDMRLALFLALHTGQRQGDLLALQWTHYAGGELRFRQSKGRDGRPGRRVVVPCIAVLRELLDDMQERATSTHILTSPRGHPWDAGNFRRRFEKFQALAGIDDVTFHDIRGTAITVLSDAGCTEAEIAAITGHTRKHLAAILEKYTARSAAQARNAVAKLEALLKANSANRTANRPEVEPPEACSEVQVVEIIGAGEGNRTLDTQLGKRSERGTCRTSLNGTGRISC